MHAKESLEKNYLNTVALEGDFRNVKAHGKIGLQAVSLNSRIVLSGHTLNKERGFLTFWVYPLEDMATRARHDSEAICDPLHRSYTLIADHPALKEPGNSAFKIVWDSGWNPVFWCNFVKGRYSYCFNEPREMEFASHYLVFKRHKWYQVALTWDFVDHRCQLFLNGIKVTTSDIFEPALRREPTGEKLYAGDPSWALADFKFFEGFISEKEIVERYVAQAPIQDDAEMAELSRIFTGTNLPHIDLKAGKDWKEALSLSLTDPAHLQYFYVQGMSESISIESEGLRMKTYPYKVVQDELRRRNGRINLWEVVEETNSAQNEPGAGGYEQLGGLAPHLEGQVYLWTWQEFEGDIYLEFEFKLLKEDGLLLLIAQASGLHREDFMRDWPLKTSGNMATVHAQNIRNYHWEFHREVADSRQDVANSALFKNPWAHPLAYQCLDSRLAVGQWHRLQFLQEGVRLRGALNHIQIFDVEDNAFVNQGPILNKGHVALRAMVKTDALIRNLTISTSSLPYQIV